MVLSLWVYFQPFWICVGNHFTSFFYHKFDLMMISPFINGHMFQAIDWNKWNQLHAINVQTKTFFFFSNINGFDTVWVFVDVWDFLVIFFISLWMFLARTFLFLQHQTFHRFDTVWIFVHGLDFLVIFLSLCEFFWREFFLFLQHQRFQSFDTAAWIFCE